MAKFKSIRMHKLRFIKIKCTQIMSTLIHTVIQIYHGWTLSVCVRCLLLHVSVVLSLSPFCEYILMQIIWLRNTNQSFCVQTRYRENIELIPIESMRTITIMLGFHVYSDLWCTSKWMLRISSASNECIQLNSIQWIWFDRFHSYVFILSTIEGIHSHSHTHKLTRVDDDNLSVYAKLYQYSVGW